MGENWTEGDEAIVYALNILAAYLTGADPRLPVVPTMFAPSLAPGDRILVQAPYRRRTWAAGQGVPDFSFQTPGLGGAGVPMPSFDVGRAISQGLAPLNLVLKKEKWRPLDAGHLFVSEAGFYLLRPDVLMPWGWRALTAAQMVGRGEVLVQGTTDHGQRVTWIVDSLWSELLFVLWAATLHRHHPQLTTGSWIPPGWIEHAREHERFPEKAAAAIAQALS